MGPAPRSRTVVITSAETAAVTRAEITTVRRIAEWPEPNTNAELQRFVTAVKRFQHWIPDFGAAAAPLVAIMTRDWITPNEKAQFWGSQQTSAFDALRGAITGGPSSLRNSTDIFSTHSHASGPSSGWTTNVAAGYGVMDFPVEVGHGR